MLRTYINRGYIVDADKRPFLIQIAAKTFFFSYLAPQSKVDCMAFYKDSIFRHAACFAIFFWHAMLNAAVCTHAHCVFALQYMHWQTFALKLIGNRLYMRMPILRTKKKINENFHFAETLSPHSILTRGWIQAYVCVLWDLGNKVTESTSSTLGVEHCWIFIWKDDAIEKKTATDGNFKCTKIFWKWFESILFISQHVEITQNPLNINWNTKTVAKVQKIQKKQRCNI